jgi:hypothetical protein
VRAEARAVLGGRLDDEGAPLGLADVQKLEYTQAVVKETLRTGALRLIVVRCGGFHPSQSDFELLINIEPQLWAP